MALVNILLPAGLGLDPGALKKMSVMVLSLALIPPAVEVAIMGVASHFIMDLPWLWAVLLGLLMGAVSPAVIIPCLFELQDRGFGVNKGIHTLVIAASALDDIACIAVFGIIIGIIFSTGSLLMQLLEGPIVIALGFTYGVIFGIVAQYLPHSKDDYLVTLRTLVIGAISILAAVGSQAVGYGGAGTLGCIISAFVACLGWRRQGWDNFNPVKANFSLLWKFFEPISFALIGMEVDFSVLESDVVLWGSICMIVALIARMLTSVAITIKSNLNLRETIFVAISSIPKATVQAALGPVALDYARNTDSVEIKSYANTMLIVSVLSIIITSPIGALLIMQGGPRLLHQTIPEKEDDDDEEQTCKQKCQKWCYATFELIEVLQALAVLLLIVILWAIAYSIWQEEVGIYSDPFALLVLFTSAKALGIVFKICKIPSIIGMIVMGVILKNARFLDLSKEFLTVAAYLRKLTLLSILLPAAFSIDPTIMRQMCALIFSVATIPTLAEILVVFLLSRFVLGLPWLWSILNGFIMGAAAPAIVIPCLFILEEKGYGNVNGVHTLSTAACILNVIESVTFFGLVYGFLTIKSDDTITSIIQGPAELLIGIGFGAAYGGLAAFLPHELDFYVVTIRTLYITCGSLLSFFGSHWIGYSGAGVLGCFCLAFVANLRWRKQGWYRHNPVRENFKLAWKFFEPISFSLIGMEIDFQKLRLNDVLLGTVVMLAGCTTHFGVTALTLKLFRTFTWGQTLFIGITTVAKATVQAALGPLALDFARETEADEEITGYAQTVLAVSVVAIVVTSPLCTVLLLNLGPKMLPKEETDPENAFSKSRVALITAPDRTYRAEQRTKSKNFLEGEQEREGGFFGRRRN